MSHRNGFQPATARRVSSMALLAFCLLPGPGALLRAASPSLSSIFPRGGQRGGELDIDFNGARLADAKEILFYSPGFSLVEFKELKDNKVRARVKIAADCKLGVHSMRVRTATGISDMKTFFVGALVAVSEKEPNSDFASPQKIALNSTVSGIVQNEDVDYYVFEVKKGQRISAEIEAMRLGHTVFDPYIAIMNQARFEIAAADDSALLRQDATCQVIAPEDGNYYVQVRESSYGGNGNCHYRLHVGTFPRPLAVLPAGARAGQGVEVSYIGDAGGPRKQKLMVPKEPRNDYGLYLEDDGGIAPSKNIFRISEYDNVLEIEPNNNHAQSSKGVAPGAFNGIISEPGDIDCFRFEAKKGQVFEVELYGRRIRSPLDSVMNISHFSGGGLAGNDDSRGPDSYFRFTAPETKEYVITVRDHLKKGGPDYVYRIELTPVKPGLSLTIPRVARYSQERQSISVPRGNRYTALVSVSRRNFGGELVFSCADLPAGLSISGENMPANMTTIPVLF
ncbi:MAG: PPC domain-containing protein, partial [Planctomycetota bacterium]|nr:PPC domain-containing protein [Planctomycetota bacterium]